MSTSCMHGFCEVFYFYDQIGTESLKEEGKGKWRKKSGFFSRSVNILLQPKDNVIKLLALFLHPQNWKQTCCL